MEISRIIPHIEALIFASEKPLTTLELTDLVNNALGFIEDRTSLEQVETAIEGIREKYQAEFYSFEVRQSGGGWQFLTKPAYHKTIAQLNGDKFLKRLSAAAMETLAIIAYKQPVTKSEVEAIRGVNCDYVMQKLLEKELIIISGRNEQFPGKPLVYSTSRTFMDYFGINASADLPRIREVLNDQIVTPTLVNSGHFELEEGKTLTVNESGELLEQEKLDSQSSLTEESPTVGQDEDDSRQGLTEDFLSDENDSQSGITECEAGTEPQNPEDNNSPNDDSNDSHGEREKE